MPETMDKRILWSVVALITVIFLIGGTHTYQSYSGEVVVIPSRPLHWGLPSGVDGRGNWQKPKDYRISGVIFYGRRQYVQMLDCYLRKNLAVNGGYLDEVIFIQNTDDEADMRFLHTLLDKVPQYRVQQKRSPHYGDYSGFWDDLVDEDTIYVKIDDDVVWMQKDAVPQIVHTLLENPHAYAVGANMINNPTCSFWHYRTGAIKAYMPEQTEPNPRNELTDWRTSKLPEYNGPDEPYPFKDGNDVYPDPVYYEGQRMLPLRNESWQIIKTPIAESHWGDGRAWKNWVLAAQQHMSLFDNIEKNSVADYVFQWRPINLHFDRYNIVFMAIRGRDVALHLPNEDDEHDLTVRNPKEFGRPFLVDTKSLCAHFGFWPQQENMMKTDILQRYRLYAEEMVCDAKRPLLP